VFEGLRVQLTRNTKNRVSRKDLKYVTSIILDLKNLFLDSTIIAKGKINRNVYLSLSHI
jgi:hypothetical protein